MPDLIQSAISIGIPAVAGLTGVLIGARLTSSRERAQRRLAFMERQLREFYSPLLGLRSDILARSELRVRVQEAADFTWRQLCEAARQIGVEALGAVSRERGPEFRRIVEYENARLERELLPAYRQMVGLFRENLWLAEPETRQYYGSLVEFIDLWDRWMAKSVPAEVLERLGHSEEGLHTFYEHLQRKHDELQASARSGTA